MTQEEVRSRPPITHTRTLRTHAYVRELTYITTTATPSTQRKTGGRRQLCGTLESDQDLDDEYEWARNE